MLLASIVLFLSFNTGSGAFEHTVGSRRMGFGSSRAPPPGINTAQLRVARVEPADDPIWDTQNSTLGVRNMCASNRDSV